MAQVIAPEVWQEGIDDNRLLPGRYTTGLFIGNTGCKNIANNTGEACRVWDIQVTDYITDYDDRRINGLLGNKWGQNADSQYNGNDGWSASAYGVFQDVRFDSRVYTMGRHRSIAMRIFDEMQYGGPIGYWGNDSKSSVITNGQALMKTAQLLSRAKEIWQAEVLGPDIDRYNLFAVINGHISGRWVQTNPDTIFNDDGTWVAQPGSVEGSAIPPRFAPIHAIEWDSANIPLMLHTLKVTWTNLFIPQDNRVILIDPFYEYDLLMALTGKGIPVTEAAYSDIQNGSFTRLMGWEFRFDIPTQYWPKIYVDDNLNVIHSADGQAAYDALINSTDHSNDGARKALMLELADADRMNRPNYVRTIWDGAAGQFRKVLTNYPLGMPSASDYMGEPYQTVDSDASPIAYTEVDGTYDSSQTPPAEWAAGLYGLPATYPWTGPGAGYGIGTSGWYDMAGTAVAPTGPVLSGGTATKRQVIGLALYKKAAQLSQEYSEMRTAEGETRGKFTEMVMDVKYDAWVIESLSHGIIPIIDAEDNSEPMGIPVVIMNQVPADDSEGD